MGKKARHYHSKSDRRKLALKLGADIALDPVESDPIVAISRENGGCLADVAIEAVGSPHTVELALKLVRKGGRINIFGVADKNALCSIV